MSSPERQSHDPASSPFGGKRVLMTVVQHYADCPGGSSRLAAEEARFLAGMGHEVWLIAPDVTGKRNEHEYVDGLHILRYPYRAFALFDPRRFSFHQRATAALLGRYLPEGVDVVHGHSIPHYVGALEACGGGARKCLSIHSPVRLELQSGSTNEPLPRRLQARLAGMAAGLLERRSIEQSDLVTVFSGYTKDLLRKVHGDAPAQKAQVIPGWTNTSRFVIPDNVRGARSRLGWPPEKPVFFTLRRLYPRMGLEMLLHAAGILAARNEDFLLVIGGSGPLEASLAKLAADLGIHGCVRFAGRIPEESLPDFYGAADAFVLPTIALECFGLIALEALSCGRPVLATPVGAIREVVGGFESRWLADDCSPGALADLLAAFLDRQLPTHTPEAAHDYVEGKYSSGVVLPRLVDAVLDRTSCSCESD